MNHTRTALPDHIHSSCCRPITRSWCNSVSPLIYVSLPAWINPSSLHPAARRAYNSGPADIRKPLPRHSPKLCLAAHIKSCLPRTLIQKHPPYYSDSSKVLPYRKTLEHENSQGRDLSRECLTIGMGHFVNPMRIVAIYRKADRGCTICYRHRKGTVRMPHLPSHQYAEFRSLDVTPLQNLR